MTAAAYPGTGSMTGKQAKFLEVLRKRHELVTEDLVALAGEPLEQLGRSDASSLIDRLLNGSSAQLKREALKARGQQEVFAGEVDERGPPRRIEGIYERRASAGGR